MINALHLLWIVPICLWAGVMCMAIFVATGDKNDTPTELSLKEVFEKDFHSNFDAFMEQTCGVVYTIDKSGQVAMLVIGNEDDISTYYGVPVVAINSSETKLKQQGNLQ